MSDPTMDRGGNVLRYPATSRSREASKVTWVGLVANVVLMVIKYIAGVLGNSAAMVADATHSLSDLATDIAVLLGFRAIRRPVDDDHDFGHGKYETVITLFIGALLLVAGIWIGLSAISCIKDMVSGKDIGGPGPIALVAALISIVSKEVLYRYTMAVGRKISSEAIKANAWHHRSDSFSSVATAVGIGGAWALGGKFVVLDPLAALIVSCLIIWISIRFIGSSFKELTEASLDVATKDRILGIASSIEGVSAPHGLRTRRIGNYIAIDLHICVDPRMSVETSHGLTREVENSLKKEFGEDTLVIVHVDPCGEDD